MKASRVLETCLYVDDLEKAEVFYTEVLGLDAFSKVRERHVFFRCGEAVLLLFNPEATSEPADNDVPVHGATGPGHVAFEMKEAEIEAWRAHLVAHGLEIEAEVTWPGGGRSLYFRDPSGNSLEVTTPRTWGLGE